jgi:hypothetical protein
MSVDLEPAGALATAGLLAAEIEGNTGKKPGVHGPSSCANCNTPLAGAYCHACGQSAHVHRSLIHIGEELLHGILHFDSKSWRTLPLLVARPGLLTRRYIDGQRARYVSPLALFLFSVFLMFFFVSMFAAGGPVITGGQSKTEARKELTQEMGAARKLIEQRRAELAKATNPEAREAATEALSDAQDDLKVDEFALLAMDAAPGTEPGYEPTDRNELMRAAASSALNKLGWDQTYPTLAHTLRHAAANPDLTLYKLKNSAYKFAFLLVPISLPFLWLMFFRRKDIELYDHAIFVLYSLSFMSLLFMVWLPVQSHGPGGLVALAIPVHLFLQLRETYALGWFATLWRTIALMVVGAIVCLCFVLLILAISLH